MCQTSTEMFSGTGFLRVSCYLDVTFLTGDNLFVNLVAAITELVGLPVPQKHFTTAHLHTQHTHYI